MFCGAIFGRKNNWSLTWRLSGWKNSPALLHLTLKNRANFCAFLWGHWFTGMFMRELFVATSAPKFRIGTLLRTLTLLLYSARWTSGTPAGRLSQNSFEALCTMNLWVCYRHLPFLVPMQPWLFHMQWLGWSILHWAWYKGGAEFRTVSIFLVTYLALTLWYWSGFNGIFYFSDKTVRLKNGSFADGLDQDAVCRWRSHLVQPCGLCLGTDSISVSSPLPCGLLRSLLIADSVLHFGRI